MSNTATVTSGSEPRQLQRRAFLVTLLLLGVVTVIFLGSFLIGDGASSTEITSNVVKADLPITVVERGELESSKTVEVRCDVEGEQIRITEVIAEGSQVEEGQVVLKFDTEKLSRSLTEQEVKWRNAQAKSQASEEDLAVAKNTAESEIAKAELALKLARIDLRKYEQGEYPQEKLSLESEVLLADEELTRSEERLQFSVRLSRKGYVSLSEVEANRGAVLKATNALKIAKENVRVLEDFTRERQMAELSSNAVEAERELERTKRSQASTIAKAEADHLGARDTAGIEKTLLEKLRQQLERCIVKAPKPGILVLDKSRPWDTASRIQPGGVVHFQRALFSLPDLQHMQVKVKIHESTVNKVRVGQTVDVRVDAYPDAVLKGTVERVATLADNRGPWDQRGVKEYETIVKILDIPGGSGLRPGMTAEVKIQVSHLKNVLIVPMQAVAEKAGSHWCFVVKGSSIEKRAVTIGDNNDKFVEIKQGLDAHEQVALDAANRLGVDKSEGSDTPAKPAASTPSQPTAAS